MRRDITREAADTERYIQLLAEYENQPGYEEPPEEILRRLPEEIRKLRVRAGVKPVHINGRRDNGVWLGYFQQRLRDGTTGYYQRRFDDCLQAAIASCLQVKPHKVPDLHIDELLRAGKEPDEVERLMWQRMNRWTEKNGVTVMLHATPPTSARRWIGVVPSGEDFSDHCLVMSGRDRLFDPADIAPGYSTLEYGLDDVDFGVTIERK